MAPHEIEDRRLTRACLTMKKACRADRFR